MTACSRSAAPDRARPRRRRWPAAAAARTTARRRPPTAEQPGRARRRRRRRPTSPVPEGVELTEPGQRARARRDGHGRLEPRQGQVGALDLKVTGIEKATFEDVRGLGADHGDAGRRRRTSCARGHQRRRHRPRGPAACRSTSSTARTRLHRVLGVHRHLQAVPERAAFPKKLRPATDQRLPGLPAPDKGRADRGELPARPRSSTRSPGPASSAKAGAGQRTAEEQGQQGRRQAAGQRQAAELGRPRPVAATMDDARP